MKINRNNYEPFFMDYLEGNLDDRLVDDFIEFLAQNPDLKEELTLFEPVALAPENIHFDKKEGLFKHKFDSENEFNLAAVACLESDIDAEEYRNFEMYLTEHPEKRVEIERFEKTKLVADTAIIFRSKNKLYRQSVTKTVLLWSGRVAAALVLALSVYLFYPAVDKHQKNNEVTVANKKPIVNETATETQHQPEAIEKTFNATTKVKAVKQPAPEYSSVDNTIQQLTAEIAVTNRESMEIPAMLNPVTASFKPEIPKTVLKTMTITIPETYSEERYLTEVVIEKTGLDKFSFKNITQAGLNFVSRISNDKFQYQTNEKGELKEVAFDSRLLAFSIPTSRSSSERTGDE